MDQLFQIDWHKMFVPGVSLIELILRGSAMYLGILVLMRIFRRQKGALNAADLLVLILVADTAQNAMSAGYQSLTEGAVLVATIFAWDYLLDALAFRSRRLHKIINGAPLMLISNGKVLRRNLRSELLTIDDLREQLREQGVPDFESVRQCHLESDGHISVVRMDAQDSSQPSPASTHR